MTLLNDTSVGDADAFADSSAPAQGELALERNRRRVPRFKRKFVSQMTPWSEGLAAVPFQVVIEDISDVGAGILHSEPLKIGVRHLLTIPRDGERPVIRQFTVMRCGRRSDGLYSIGLEVEDISPPPPTARTMAWQKTKLWCLLFAIIALLVVTFMPL